MLTVDNVKRVLSHCLHVPTQDADTESIQVEGLVNNFLFSRSRLEASKDEIAAMLAELPGAFQQSGGGGMPFLNACNTKDGVQWADSHQYMEWLFALGMGVGKVEYCAPREIWSSLPGGMPYLVILP